jgi:hypothetical protein
VSGSEHATDDDYRRLIIECDANGDWHGTYRYAKGWIGSGGGAPLLDPWLAYVASALSHRRPRLAVNSVDLALRHWFEPLANRSVLHWVRSRVVRFRLNDPKTALSDVALAEANAPAWLLPHVVEDARACSEEATTSRKRKPSVERAPEFAGITPGVTEPNDAPGTKPLLWPLVLPYLSALDTNA